MTVDKKMLNFLENASLLLGFSHGSIAHILQSPDSELRGQLTKLKQELDDRVSKLYYADEV